MRARSKEILEDTHATLARLKSIHARIGTDMSDGSKELEDALAVVKGVSGRLGRMKRRPLDVPIAEQLRGTATLLIQVAQDLRTVTVQAPPTREETEAFMIELSKRYILAWDAREDILDFIYGKTE